MGAAVKDSDASAEMEAFARLLAGYEQARNEGLAPINPALEEFLNAKRLHESCENEDIRIPGLHGDKSESKAQEIVPQAFYFVKVHDSQGQKYFINMCGCPEIAAPGEWQDGVPPELEESFSKLESDADDGTHNVRFSLSCSDHVLLPDNRGTMCKVYDVVFNLLVMRHSMVHNQLKAFLINMAITWISQKFNIELSDDFKVPKGKYKGDHVRKHHIRAPKTQLVCEIPDVHAELEPSFPLLVGNSSSRCVESQNITSLEPSNRIRMEDENLKPERPLTTDVKQDLIDNGTAQSPACIGMECEKSVSSLDCVQHKTAESMSPTDCTKVDSTKSISSSDYFKDDTRKTMSSTDSVNEETIQRVASTDAVKEEITKIMPTTNNHRNIEEYLLPTSSCDNTIVSQGHKKTPISQLSPSAPEFQFTYIGRPVELVILNISLPSTITLQNLEVLVSDNHIFVESDAREIIMVPLVFSTTAMDVKASFYNSDSMLELYLPFCSYTEMLAR